MVQPIKHKIIVMFQLMKYKIVVIFHTIKCKMIVAVQPIKTKTIVMVQQIKQIKQICLLWLRFNQSNRTNCYLGKSNSCFIRALRRFQQSFSHIATVSGCGRELNVHFYSAA